MQPDDDSQHIDALARAFYSVFDNRQGRSAGVDEVVAFFHESAVIAKRTAAGFETCAPEAFARPRVELLRSGALTGFHEWETWSETHVDGDLATRRSHYAKSGTMDGGPYAGSGTKLFQCIRVRGRWRILSLAWADDE